MDAGAGLHWAFRESFREYVTAIDDGRIDRRQVDLDAMGRFVFRRSGRSSRSLWVFEGRVDFWAHFGVLNFSLYDVCIEFGPRPCISVGPQTREKERVVLAELEEVAAQVPGTHEFTAMLTADGARVLGGVYSVGDPLERLTVSPVGCSLSRD
ncbi:HtaA domain-containing protein [Rhodococcus koreensis]|uniref:Htaa protein n=2 Tax=Rhodococcus koreensis TaxID=99653 RepID=A0A1H4KZZ8_9NOCA|nr:HtaA domain-containing protein [Rhodococcus koreensis]SEB64094.1 Htaa protein [Rhodococcus koreensis]